MKAYHGTNNDFRKFSLSFLGTNTDDNASSDALRETAHLGVWFTDNKEFASSVYDRVMECELDIENPIMVDSLEYLEFWVAVHGLPGEEIREKLLDDGYDSIVVGYDEEFEGRSVVMLTVEKITVLS